jgi:hypothetical protein
LADCPDDGVASRKKSGETEECFSGMLQNAIAGVAKCNTEMFGDAEMFHG